MRQVLLTLFFLIALSALIFWVFTNENAQKIVSFERQLEALQAENSELNKKNEALRRHIRNLKADPRLVEQHARQNSGLVRSHESVYQFVDASKPQTVAVIFTISNKKATLAGQNVDENSFGNALDLLKKRIPGASLKIQLDKDVDPIREQIFYDIIRQKDIRILEQ